MRNLKRALSLVMAAAMLIGMMVVGASAASTYEDFTDKDEIKNTEAVNTMVSLGVIAGKEDGSYFDPTGIVTRAEMAKLIAVSLNGGKDLVMGSGASATQFTDTKGNWAEAYIAYCANLGIINGKGDGTFGPSEPVTGTAAAKMMLTALGYRSDIEKLTGTGWDLNTDTLAMKVGLYDGLDDLVPSSGLSRDDTAQLVYNGVQANEVEYKNNYGEYSGVIYAQPNGTMLANRFKVVKVTGILLANDKLSVANSTGYVNAVARENESLLNVTDVSGYPVADYSSLYDEQTYKVITSDEMVGQEVVLYVKYLNSLSPNANSSTVMGNAILTNKNTVVETSARLKDADAVRKALRDGGLSAIGTPTAYAFDHTGRHAGVATGITDTIAGNARSAGVLQRFIDNNGNGTPDYIIQILPTLAKVSAVNSSSEKYTFSAPVGAQNFDDVVAEDLEKNDYVLLTQYSDGKYYAEKTTTAEGEATAYNTGNNKVTLDGEAYGNGAGANISDLEKTLSTALIGGNYRLHLDKYGNVLGFEEISAAIGNYAVVRGASVTGSSSMGYSAKVKITMQDGTTATYDIDAAASAVKLGLAVASDSTDTKEAAIFIAAYLDPANSGGSSLIDHLFTYTLDDGVVTLSLPENVNSKYQKITDVTAGQTIQSTKANYITDASGNILADGNTVFFFKNKDNSYSVVTGLSKLTASGVTMGTTNAPASTLVREAIYYKASGSSTQAAKAIFVSLNANYSSSKNYAFISGDYTQSSSSGTPIYTYPVVLEDGTAGTLATKSANGVKNSVMEYTTDSNNYVSFTSAAPAKMIVDFLGNGSVGIVDASTGVAPSPANYVLASALKVWNVEDTENIYETTLSEGDVISGITNSDNELKAIFIYDNVVNGQADEPVAVALTVTNATLGNGNLLSGSGSVTGADVTTTLTVTVTPDTGNTVSQVTVGATSASAATATHTVTAADLANGYVDVSVILTKGTDFARVENYTINLGSTSYSVSYIPGNSGLAAATLAANNANLFGGESHTIVAAPANVGYTFVGWYDGVALHAAGSNITMSGNVTLTPVYVSDTATATDANAAGGLAGAGFSFTFTENISGLIAGVTATGAGSNGSSITGASATDADGAAVYAPDFVETDSLDSCTTGDSIAFAFTITGVSPVTVTYSY